MHPAKTYHLDADALYADTRHTLEDVLRSEPDEDPGDDPLAYRTQGWHRTARGNLARRLDGRTLVVFKRFDRYRWAIYDQTGARYSRHSYATEFRAWQSLEKAALVPDEPQAPPQAPGRREAQGKHTRTAKAPGPTS